ncbi:conserved hypothetical protein [Candidatus Magnetomoraceae bacterium gMMP-13]
MIHWIYREELSHIDKLRRSYYEILRDELDQFMIKYALVDSYNQFLEKKIPYPFVEKRELKPRARIPDLEYESHNAFLVIFMEESIPTIHKKYIRFFDVNKVNKTNLLNSVAIPITDTFDRKLKYLESIHFFNFLNMLLPVDYALLIQRDKTTRVKNRYSLSHFHVRIDWPIADATEELARSLRYISKDLYEKGDRYAEDLQKKFFEYYGLPVMVGGRRTAAIVAAQYLKQTPYISTIYVGSSESRALLRLSERGVSKFILMKFSYEEMMNIAKENDISYKDFIKNYLIEREGKDGIGIFHTTYTSTVHSQPPEDGKLRELNPDLFWLSVYSQYILPRPDVSDSHPLPYNIIYS